MDEKGEFRRLVQRLRDGDEGAAEALYRQYGPFLRAAVRRQLRPRLRTRYDSLDFVQDVWASFLALPAGRYTFDSPATLLAFLRRVAYYKVFEKYRGRFGTQRDDANREVRLEETDWDHPDGPRARTPTPSQDAIAGEELERLLRRLPPGYRVIVQRLREGYSHTDIARMTHVSRSTVERVIRRLKELTGV